MKVLVISSHAGYAQLVKETATGSRCQVHMAGYGDGVAAAEGCSLVLVEAALGDSQGLITARAVLKTYPGMTLVFLMEECRYEYSMAAMRMGAKNILVGEEINRASLELILAQCEATSRLVSKDAIARNFERMIFFQNSNCQQEGCYRFLNSAFDMGGGKHHYYVMLLTGLDYACEQAAAETVMKKILNEKGKEQLSGITAEGYYIPFAFDIDKLFYLVAICEGAAGGISPRQQASQLQRSILAESRAFLGDRQTILCSKRKSDFSQFSQCLEELALLADRMHCSDYPCMLSSYSAPLSRPVGSLEGLLQEGAQVLQAIKSGGEYDPSVRALFSLQNMAGLQYTQFVELKSLFLYEFQSEYKKLTLPQEAMAQLQSRLEKLRYTTSSDYARKLILQLADSLTTYSGKRYHHLVARCIKLISQHYMHEISLQEMADTLNISNVYLSGLFRRETGQNFSAYVSAYRLEKARELIEEGDSPLSRIYEAVGFSNQQYFSNCFKKAYGLRPSEYKARHRKA